MRDDWHMKKAVDRIAAEVKPIAPELAEVRDAIWTPDKDEPAAGPGDEAVDARQRPVTLASHGASAVTQGGSDTLFLVPQPSQRISARPQPPTSNENVPGRST